MSEITLGILSMPDDLFWNDEPLTRVQHNAARKEAAKEIVRLRADADRLSEAVKTNVYFARVIKQAAEEYLSSNGCPPEWWTIPLMHEIKELLGIVTETRARAALAEHERGEG